MLALLYDFRTWLLNQQWFTSTLLPAMPRSLRWTLRRLYFLPSDFIKRMVGDRDEMVPPHASIFTGSVDDFRSSGEALVRRLAEFGVLAEDSKVLDVGSGMGRVAVGLISYRGGRGSYQGLDIVPAGVKWCRENITSKHESYDFMLADIFNKEYNPTGRLKSSEYEFPFADGTFDLAVLASVFTHMLPEDMRQYVAEVARVLKRGGTCCASFNLLNAESLGAMEAGRSAFRFTCVGPHWVVDVNVPELAVAYEEAYVRHLFEQHGLSCSIHHGWWSGRTGTSRQSPRFFGQDDQDYRYFDQDYVLATKV
ncbi:MAG: class I SAM-dependent methyltransferase [Actinomycetota bacterium]|nr:class I SAM-dependent methyltransferase [Actinomycetota bacterium]